MENKHNFINYLLTFFVALLFGTGGLWQYLNYKLESEKIQFEKEKYNFEILNKTAMLYTDLNDAVVSIIKLNEKYNSIADKSFSNQYKKNYDIQYHALVNQTNSIKQVICNIEKKEMKHFQKIPSPIFQVSPFQPTSLKIKISEENEMPTTLAWVLFFCIISIYTIFTILLTIYLPKFILYIKGFIKK